MLFGEYVRTKRREMKLSIRDFAETLGISPVYQSSIETGKRAAPSWEIMQRMEELFGLGKEERALFYDLAAATTDKGVPLDIAPFISENAPLRAFIRAVRDGEITEAEMLRLLHAKGARKKKQKSE